METSHRLRRTIYPARTFAYLLAVLILLQLDNRGALFTACLLICLAYPLLAHRLTALLKDNISSIRRVMLIDGLLVGVLLSLSGFNLEASVVLLSLLGISVVILGGIMLMLAVIPLVGLGALCTELLYQREHTGGAGFYFIAYLALVSYALMVGLLVFEETRRLNRAHRAETSVRQRLEQFKSVVSPFLPRQLVTRDRPRSPDRRQLTVFFSDIEGFTRLMETVDEGRVAYLLNRYFGCMSDIASGYGGTLDKFIGDGLLVFFGDPHSRGPAGDALACVAMALEMRDRFSALSSAWEREEGITRLRIRMGLSTGYCLVGEFGNAARKDYTVLGSVVNRASRLESAAAADEILVSAETWRLISPAVSGFCRGDIRLRGFSRPVKAYSVTGLVSSDSASVQLLT